MRRTETDGFATWRRTHRQDRWDCTLNTLPSQLRTLPNNNILYNGTDGGIWRSEGFGYQLAEPQQLHLQCDAVIQSVAVHPTDRS